jgi:transposase
MARAGPRKVQRYSLEFKLTAVRMSHEPGVQVQTVADALDIHPFMLSKWRKEVRDGVLRGQSGPRPVIPKREIVRLQRLEVAHARLREEHALLKKAIRFCSTRRGTSSPSSTKSGRPTGSVASAGSTGSPGRATMRGGAGGRAAGRNRTGS